MARLQRSCSLRETCSQTARKKLAQWKILPEDAARIMQKLTAEQWVDDRRYAEAFAREKSRLAKWGAIKIRTHLQAKQIPASDINHALGQIEKGNEQEAIKEILNKKAKSVQAKSPHDFFAKLLRFGISRGYEYGEVVKAVRAIAQMRNEEEAIL